MDAALGGYGKIRGWSASVSSLIAGIIMFIIGISLTQKKSCKTSGVITSSVSSPPSANTYNVTINSIVYRFQFTTSMTIGDTVTLYNCNPDTNNVNVAQTLSDSTMAIFLIVFGIILPLLGASLVYAITKSPVAAEVYGGVSLFDNLTQR